MKKVGDFGNLFTNRTKIMDGWMNISEFRLPQVCAEVRSLNRYVNKAGERRPEEYNLIKML